MTSDTVQNVNEGARKEISCISFRKLGIPTVLDRTLQQSIVQVLTPIFEAEFQEHSYGFRPGRSCEEAVRLWTTSMGDMNR